MEVIGLKDVYYLFFNGYLVGILFVISDCLCYKIGFIFYMDIVDFNVENIIL